MREILFRGKRKDNGEMIFGNLNQHKTGKVFIKSGSAVHSFEVDPETVGQYTGLTDKNGKKIFEGDIVGYCWYDTAMNFRIDFVSGEFLAVPLEKRKDVWAIRISGQGENFEVIGNIHDNPELLKGGAEDG